MHTSQCYNTVPPSKPYFGVSSKLATNAKHFYTSYASQLLKIKNWFTHASCL